MFVLTLLTKKLSTPCQTIALTYILQCYSGHSRLSCFLEIRPVSNIHSSNNSTENLYNLFVYEAFSKDILYESLESDSSLTKREYNITKTGCM